MTFPERIICLTEETVETLYLLGEQDRIVGITGYAVRPPEARREKPKSLGHVPVVDINFRTNADLKAEHQAEAKRRALIHLPDPDRAIYNFRTMVERINARLKDEFGGRFVRVRGAMKVKCHLMFGMLALTVDQIFRAFKA